MPAYCNFAETARCVSGGIRLSYSWRIVAGSDGERKKYAAKCLWIGVRSLLAGIGLCFGVSRYMGDTFVVSGASQCGQFFSDGLPGALCLSGVLRALRATDGHHLTVYGTAVNMHMLLLLRLRHTP